MVQPSLQPRRPSGNRIRRLLPLGLLLLAGGGFGLQRASTPNPAPPMPVPPPLRKQVLQGYMPFGSIGWVNNEQVVFSGRPVNSQQKNGLYLWDQQKAPRLLLAHSPGGCISNGKIEATQLSEGGKDRRFAIPPPDLTPRQVAMSHAPPKSKFEPVSCSRIATPIILEEHKWAPLRKGEGFLDFGTPNDPISIQQVKHLSPDLLTHRLTGIRMEQPMLPKVVHASHDDSYLVFDLNQTPSQRERWINTDNRVIWRLNSRLRGSPIRVPAGTWVNPVGGDLAFLDARPGLLISSKNFARNREAGGAGLYLLAPGGAAQRLERGLVENAAASPNGCRIAYGFRPRLDTGIPEGGPRLVILDLCPDKSASNS